MAGCFLTLWHLYSASKFSYLFSCPLHKSWPCQVLPAFSVARHKGILSIWTVVKKNPWYLYITRDFLCFMYLTYCCFKNFPSFLSSMRIWFISTAICPFSFTRSVIVGLSKGICEEISFNCFL